LARGAPDEERRVTGALLAAAWAPAAIGPAESVADWAAQLGYLAVVLIVAGDGVFPLLPGETAIISAAVLAADGRLSVTLVILAGALGAVLGDSSAFWIGRLGGVGIRRLAARLAGHDRVVAAERMIRRQGPALVFVGRFLPGFRLAVNLSCGAGQMSYPRFLLFDAAGAAVWSTQAALLGFFLGKAFADQLWVALLVALAVVGVVGLVVWWRERKRMQREKELAAAEGAPLPDA
jgi:membrane protein DedA with SNARE-associated domain